MARGKCNRMPIRVAFSMDDKAAIYAIWSVAGICLYVGKTKRLKTRLIEHIRSSHNKDLKMWIDVYGIGETYFCYRDVDDLSMLSRMEEKFIKLLHPKTNILV